MGMVYAYHEKQGCRILFFSRVRKHATNGAVQCRGQTLSFALRNALCTQLLILPPEFSDSIVPVIALTWTD